MRETLSRANRAIKKSVPIHRGSSQPTACQVHYFPKNSFTFLDFWSPKPPKTPKMLKYRGFGGGAHSHGRTVQLKSLSLYTGVVHNPLRVKFTISQKIVTHFSTSGAQNPLKPQKC